MNKVIDTGSAPNDSTGDPLKMAFDKVNDNFAELYSAVGEVAPLVEWADIGDTRRAFTTINTNFAFLYARLAP